jgi:CRISPR-associated protein Csd1
MISGRRTHPSSTAGGTTPKPGLGVMTDRLLQEVVSELQGFPKTMRLEEQAVFALGFYHQRQAFFT